MTKTYCLLHGWLALALRRSIGYGLGFVFLLGFSWILFDRLVEAGVLGGGAEATRVRASRPAPVSVAPIELGRLKLVRVYSGTLEAKSRFLVAPKVGGRVESVTVDLGDRVERGQLIAELDDDEFSQAVEQAKADLAVAQATIIQAENALKIAERELTRITTLREPGLISESQFDDIKAQQLARLAAVEVAKARAGRAESALRSTEIRLGYTRVTANWPDSEKERIVAERYLDPGETVAANSPLMAIVDLDPMTGVIFATEKDYAKLRVGQTVELSTDAYADRLFEGKVARVSPVFREASRQARVELEIENRDESLKPGMYVRAKVELEEIEGAKIVPEEALVTREDMLGLFVVDESSMKVDWVPVELGIRQEGRVQVLSELLNPQSRVVTLGQQLLEAGSEISIPEEPEVEGSSEKSQASDGESS